jgi:acylglycerol lipase
MTFAWVALAAGVPVALFLAWKWSMRARPVSLPFVHSPVAFPRLPVPGQGLTFPKRGECDFVSHGVTIRSFSWPAEGGRKAKAVLVLFHGWNEHINRHSHVAQRFASEGFDCYGFDFRGFGHSGGHRGYIDDYHKYADDAERFCELVAARHPPGTPMFLYGQSMGGKTCLHLALRDSARPLNERRYAGMLLAVPAIVAKEDLAPIMQKLAAYAVKLFPRVVIMKLGRGLGSRNPCAIEHFETDPLCFLEGIMIGTGHALLTSCKFLTANLDKVQTPFIVIQGSEDKLVEPVGTRMLYERAATPKAKKEMIFMEGVWHDVMHEPEADQALDHFARWANSIMASR